MTIPRFKELLADVIAGKELVQWLSYIKLDAFTEKEVETARRAFEEILADSNHPQRSHVLFLRSFCENDSGSIIPLLEAAKNAGNYDAMAYLGAAYFMQKNDAEGKKWLDLAIEHGNSYAMFFKACSLRSDEDHTQYEELLSKAIANGNTFAMIEMGDLYTDLETYEDKHVQTAQEHDFQTAIKYYDDAIKSNNMLASFAKAQFFIDLSNFKGIQSREQYRREAVEWINHLIHTGHPNGVDLKAHFLLREQMSIFSDKIDDLNNRHETQAATAAQNIETALLEKMDDLLEAGLSPENFKIFKESCSDLINNADTELSKHRGWSEFLVNLALTITVVGILIKGAINIANNRSFFFVHDTDSIKKLKEFSEKVHALDIHGDLTP